MIRLIYLVQGRNMARILFCVATFLAVQNTLCSNEVDKINALKFLSKFGYLSMSRSGNQDVGKALKMYQDFMGLPVTGVLDQATQEEMKKPRCGVPDIDNGTTRLRRYSTYGRWWKTHLTYYIQFGEDLYGQDYVKIFAEAFNRWSKAAPNLKFTRIMDPKKADFKISFGFSEHYGVPGEQKCSSNFDGWNGVLAHAYMPSDGRIHFDEKEWWSAYENHGLFKQPLPQVATHEIGHALGLRHSKVKGSMMWPSCCESTADLHQDDIDGIKKLYG